MNVLLINGSPHEKGCTYTALSLIAGELNKAGIDTEILHVGGKPVGGCIGCGGCRSGNGCVFGGVVNEAIEKAKTADGFVFGSPVHYASASGNMTSFMDRLSYAGGKYLAYKPAARRELAVQRPHRLLCRPERGAALLQCRGQMEG